METAVFLQRLAHTRHDVSQKLKIGLSAKRKSRMDLKDELDRQQEAVTGSLPTSRVHFSTSIKVRVWR